MNIEQLTIGKAKPTIRRGFLFSANLTHGGPSVHFMKRVFPILLYLSHPKKDLGTFMVPMRTRN